MMKPTRLVLFLTSEADLAEGQLRIRSQAPLNSSSAVLLAAGVLQPLVAKFDLCWIVIRRQHTEVTDPPIQVRS